MGKSVFLGLTVTIGTALVCLPNSAGSGNSGYWYTASSYRQSGRAHSSEQQCSDNWHSCKPKVKVIGHEGDCTVYACEVGTKNEHIVKTSNREGKKLLDKAARGVRDSAW